MSAFHWYHWLNLIGLQIRHRDLPGKGRLLVIDLFGGLVKKMRSLQPRNDKPEFIDLGYSRQAGHGLRSFGRSVSRARAWSAPTLITGWCDRVHVCESNAG